MKIDGNSMSVAVNGIKRGMDDLEKNAKDIAQSADGSGKEVIRPLVESRLNQQQVEANIATVKTLDVTLGTLLDEEA